MIVKIFTQPSCPKCPEAKKLGKELEKIVKVEYFDIKDVDGLAESTYYDVLSTPSIVIVNDEKELVSWRGETPKIEEVKRFLES